MTFPAIVILCDDPTAKEPLRIIPDAIRLCVHHISLTVTLFAARAPLFPKVTVHITLSPLLYVPVADFVIQRSGYAFPTFHP